MAFMRGFCIYVSRIPIPGKLLGRGTHNLPMPPQVWSSQAEFRDAAVQDRRGGLDVAMRVGQFRELPEKPAVCGEPQRQ